MCAVDIMDPHPFVLEAPEAGTIKVRDLQPEAVVEQQAFRFGISAFGD